MELKINRSTFGIIPLAQISPGDCFMINKNYYCKIDENDPGGHTICFDLTTNKIVKMKTWGDVKIIKAEVIIHE